MCPGRPAATRPPGAVRDTLVTGCPATNRPRGMAGTRRWPIRGVGMPGQRRTRRRPAGRARHLPALLAVEPPVILLLNGRCGVPDPANQLTTGALPDRGSAAAARTAVIPGEPIARRAGLAAMTSRAQLPAGGGASPAASMAGPPRPGLHRQPIRMPAGVGGLGPGVSWTGTLAGTDGHRVSGRSRAAWPRRVTRLETVTCPRRPARPSCGQSPPVGGWSHPADRCPGGWPAVTAAAIQVRQEASRASSIPGRGRSSHRACCAGGIGRNQNPARPRQAVSGRRRTGSRPRLLPARITAGHGPIPRIGASRRLVAGGAAGRRRLRTSAGRSLPAETAVGQRLPGIVAGRMRPGTMVGQSARPGGAATRQVAETMTSGQRQPPRLARRTAPQARARPIQWLRRGRPWAWCPPKRPRRLSAAGWPRKPHPRNGPGLTRPRPGGPAAAG
jgi:hypothetical protein